MFIPFGGLFFGASKSIQKSFPKQIVPTYLQHTASRGPKAAPRALSREAPPQSRAKTLKDKQRKEERNNKKKKKKKNQKKKKKKQKKKKTLKKKKKKRRRRRIRRRDR